MIDIDSITAAGRPLRRSLASSMLQHLVEEAAIVESGQSVAPAPCSPGAHAARY